MLRRVKTTLEMVKIEHTVFALPFAFLGAFLRARGFPSPGEVGWWILLAMVGARSAAMALNISLVKPSDLSRVNTAFFTVNGWISLLLFLATSIDLVLFKAT